MSKGFIFTCLCAVSWASSIVLSRVILNSGENPYNLAFWSSLFAFPYWITIAYRERSHFRIIRHKDWLVLFAMAMISSVAVGFAEVFAIKYSPAVNFAFLIRTVSVFTIIFAAIFLHEKITWKKLILLITITVGAYFLTTNGHAFHVSKGDIYTLTEAALIAFGTNILAKFATNRLRPDTAASGRFLIAIMPTLAIAMLNTTIHIPMLWPLILTIALLDISLSQFMFRAFKYSTASFVTMVMSFTPVLVSFMAIPILKESLTPIEMIGGLLIISSGILVEKLKI